VSKLEEAAELGPASVYSFAAWTSIGRIDFRLESRLRMVLKRPSELAKAVMVA